MEEAVQLHPKARFLKQHAFPSALSNHYSSAFILLITFLSLVAVFTFFFSSNIPVQKKISLYEASQRIVEADNAVVAADDGRCSVVGVDILRKGGHVIDATVATALCLGVVASMSSGLGGGSFMLLRLANGHAEAYDMRETAPAAATQEMYSSDPSKKKSGPLSVGVPGELAGLHLAWQKYGRLPWKQLFEPAVSLASKGFEVSPYLAYGIKEESDSIMADEGLQTVFAPNGKLLQAGDICVQKSLAKTLNAIAEFGPSIFYNGTIGVKLIGDLQEKGGIMTMQDLHDYRVKVKAPISREVMGYKILGIPPPSSGGAGLILILNILANYEKQSTLQGVLGLHRIIEAFKHMFAVRMNLGDPDFVNITDVVRDMISPQFARQAWKRINDSTTFESSYYGGKWNQLKDHGTSHFGIVDNNRNAVAFTTTVNSHFGAKILSESTGIVLNNEMDDFSVPSNIYESIPEAMSNFVMPNKRPLSSMSPTILLKNDELRGVLGASGGIKIIPATAQVLLNMFVNGMEPLSSVTSARVYPELVPNTVQYEDWLTVSGDYIEVSSDVRDGLREKGHKLQPTSSGAVSQLIVHHPSSEGVYPGKLIAVSDPRNSGHPAGY